MQMHLSMKSWYPYLFPSYLETISPSWWTISGPDSKHNYYTSQAHLTEKARKELDTPSLGKCFSSKSMNKEALAISVWKS